MTSDNELVVLTIAAAMTYFYVTDHVRQSETRDPLGELLPLVAVALAGVAPILRPDGTRLSEAELDELLLRGRAGVPPSAGTVAGLRIRRADLYRAMETFKEARVAFGQPRGSASAAS
jgi:hypothetical protein